MTRAKPAHVDPRRAVAAGADIDAGDELECLVERARVPRLDVGARDASRGANLLDDFGRLGDGDGERRNVLCGGADRLKRQERGNESAQIWQCHNPAIFAHLRCWRLIDSVYIEIRGLDNRGTSHRGATQLKFAASSTLPWPL